MTTRSKTCSSRGSALRLCMIVMLLIHAPGISAATGLSMFASGLSSPLFMTYASGIEGRLYVVEKGSRGSADIKSVDTKGNIVSTLLTIKGLTDRGERGLLGLAFHPNVAENGFFYVYTSVPGGAANHQSWVRRYKLINKDSADPASETAVLRFDQDYGNHNGGWMAFGPDGFLYIGTGDGGAGGDPKNRAQNTGNLLGKLLRIDVDGDDFRTDPLRNYAIPADNPFVGESGRDEIWAYGLRNPWRCSFDRLNGDLYIADVGQNAYEEINFARADAGGGINYGWRVMEAQECFDDSRQDDNPGCGDKQLTGPIYQYPHGSWLVGGRSITGGYVYRGPDADLHGKYFFADFVSNRVWSLTVDRDKEKMAPGSLVDWTESFNKSIGSKLKGIASFAEDADGNLYIIGLSGGSIYKIEDRDP